MDPITIMSVLVLAGFIGAGADLATGGLVRAEFGGGARGAASYLGSAGRKRWQESRRLARQERMKTPMGRAVQFILDEVGGLGRGLVRGWRSGARRGRKAWREHLGDGPIPAVRVCRDLGDQTRTWLERRANRGAPNEDPNAPRCTWTSSPFGLSLFGIQKSCGQPATVGPFCARHDEASTRTDCADCLQPMGSNPNCEECTFLGIARGEVGPYGPESPNDARQDPIGTRSATPNGDSERAPNGPNGTRTATPNGRHVEPDGWSDDGCIVTIAWGSKPAPWLPEGHMRWPRYCGERCEPGWRICPEHKAERLADPDYPSDDINEYRADPNGDGAPTATPNQPIEGEPNMSREDPIPTIGDGGGPGYDGGGDYHNRFGDWMERRVAARTARGGGTTGGGDINSAPAAIALFEAFRGRFEEPESLLTALRDEIAAAADSMGDFAIGGEGDLSAGPRAALDAVVHAKEALDAYLSSLHLEYDASIEAAAAKAAAAHRPMQEA